MGRNKRYLRGFLLRINVPLINKMLLILWHADVRKSYWRSHLMNISMQSSRAIDIFTAEKKKTRKLFTMSRTRPAWKNHSGFFNYSCQCEAFSGVVKNKQNVNFAIGISF
jgi:hypothetical protein